MRWVLGLAVGATVVGMSVGGALAQTAPVQAAPSEKAPEKPKAVKSVKVKGADTIRTGSLPPAPPPIAYASDPGLRMWYVERGGVRMPSGDRLAYCHGYNCLYQKIVDIDPDDLKQLQAIFATRTRSPAAEREGIDLAVSWWEKKAAPLLGGPPDVRGSDFAHSNRMGQTDCLDEATNSTTILIYLQQKGLLRYHHVERPDSRGGLLVTLVHATAVFKEIGGEDWVVDSWMRDSGDPNDVMPLAEWSSKLM